MLLLDNNLSPKLRRYLLPVFPGTVSFRFPAMR